MAIIEFQEDIDALGGLWPGGRAPRLFPMDPARYQRLFRDGLPDRNYRSLEKLRKRLPRDAFGAVFASLDHLLRYSASLFPGFRNLYGEFVNEEWLALVDYHKAFHRDHVVHQPQVALVVRRLLGEIRFDCDRHPLAIAFTEAPWTPYPPDERRVTLHQLAAYTLAKGEAATTYLDDYARELGVDPRWLEPETDACYWFWYGVIYNAAVTAALFHDIGYPLQFLHQVTHKVRDGRFADLIQGGDVRRIDELFDDPLCLMPFRGYRSSRRIALSHTVAPEVVQVMGRALRGSHGLPGALTFLHLNHEVMDLREPRRNARGRLTMELAALAIVMHDMEPIFRHGGEARIRPAWPGQPLTPRYPHLRVAFHRDPVSFVVALADQIQNFGRFHARFTHEEVEKTDAETKTQTKVILPVLNLEHQVKRSRLEYDPEGREMTITSLYDRKNLGTMLQQLHVWGPGEEVNGFHPHVGFLDYRGLFDRITLRADTL
ncbi:hypothetical protein [Endothiovibrio diazotrophicus]